MLDEAFRQQPSHQHRVAKKVRHARQLLAMIARSVFQQLAALAMLLPEFRFGRFFSPRDEAR